MNLESKFFGNFVGYKRKAVRPGAFELLSQKAAPLRVSFTEARWIQGQHHTRLRTIPA